MKIRTLTVLLALTGIASLAFSQDAPKGTKESASYALGMQMASQLHGYDIDMAAFARGMKDANSGAKPAFSNAELVAAMNFLRDQVSAKAQAEQSEAADKNQKAGELYLAENLKKQGVKATASGLQYKVLKSGNGKSPKGSDVVSVNYRGTLISGKEFDASREGPASFPVNGVIPGWTEALQLMKEGDKWQITIPAKLAYGAKGAGSDIGPNEVLVFEVELVQVR